MKCPNAECGFVEEKSFKFCPECGTKMVIPQKLEVALCRNLLDDGSLCNAEVKISYKFCKECGGKVDKAIFDEDVKCCVKCKKKLAPDERFCSGCGTKASDNRGNMPSSNVGEAENSQVGPHGDSGHSPGELPARPTIVKKDVVERADQAVEKGALVAAQTDTQAQAQAGGTQIKTQVSRNANSIDPVVASGAGVAVHTDAQAQTQAGGTQIKTQVSRNANSVDPVVASGDGGAAHTDTQAQTQVSDTQIKTPGSKIDKSFDPVIARGDGVAAHTDTQAQTQVGDTQTKTAVSKIDNSVDPVVARGDGVAVCDDTQAKTQVGLIDKTVLEPENSDDQRASVDTGLNSTTNTSDLTKNFQNVTLGPNMPSVQDMAQSMMSEPTVVQTTNNVQNDTSDASVGQTENNGQNKTLEPMEITISEENKAIDDQEGRDSQSGDAESTDSDHDEFENTDQQRDDMITEASPASEKKRKRRTKKKDYKNKRERKREKLAVKKSDGKTAQSLALNEETSIQKHEWLEHRSEQQQNEKADNSTSQTQSDSHAISHPLDNNNSPNVVNIGNKGKVFGEFADNYTAATSSYEVRYPPGDKNSLFKLDTKTSNTKVDTGNVDNKMSKPDPKPGENVDSVHESSNLGDGNLKKNEKKNKTGNGSKGLQQGIQTRSQAKTNQNSQKTSGSGDKTKKAENKNKQSTEESRNVGVPGKVNERMVQVHFIALISQDFNLNQNTDKVFIRGNLETGAYTWSNKHHEMKFTGKNWNGNLEVEYKLDIPYSRFPAQGFEYKYFVVKNKGTDTKEMWECYVKYDRTGAGANRTLNIPDKLRSNIPDVMQKYDGIVNRDPKAQGWLGRIVDYFRDSKTGKLTRDCEEVVQYFCSRHMMFDSPSAVKENMDKIFILIYQLTKIYQIDGECWRNAVEFRTEMGDRILKHVMDSLITAQEAKDRQTSLVICLTLASIVKALSLYVINLPEEQQRILCRAFLIQASEDGETCFEVEFIEKHYSKQRTFLKDGILQIMKSVVYGKYKDPSWLFLVPLLHFLNGDCKPYELPQKAAGHQDFKPVWWGVTLFQDWASDFKRTDKRWVLNTIDVLEALQPLFVVDFFLPRTFMACLRVEESAEVLKTGKIPVDVCCASLNFILKVSSPQLYQFTFSITNDEQVVLQCIEQLKNHIRSDSAVGKSTKATLASSRMSYEIAEDMYKNSLQINTVLESSCMVLFLYCVEYFNITREKLLSSIDKDSTFEKSILNIDTNTIIRHSLIETQNWLRRKHSYWHGQMNDCLKVWNSMMLADNFISKETTDVWNGTLQTDLENQLNSYQEAKKESETENETLSGSNTEKLIQLYCSQVDIYKPSMQEIMSKVVIMAIEKGYKFDFGGFHEADRKRFGQLLSDMFVKYWDKTMMGSSEAPDETILKLVLSWPPFSSFLQVLNKYQEDIKKNYLLSEACIEKLVMAVSVVEGRCTALHSGEITVSKLYELQNCEDKLVPIVTLMKNGGFTGEVVSKLIKIRCKEVEMVKQKASLLTKLTSICHLLRQVNTSKQDAVLAKVDTIGRYCVKDFCKPLDVATVENVENCHPDLSVFEISSEVDQILEPLSLAYRSSAFSKLWDHQCGEQQEICTSLDDVVENVWKPVQDRWTKISRNIASGEILFSDLEHHVGTTYWEDYEAMKNELLAMGINEKIVDRRLKQLQQYRQLETSVRGAKVILKFARLYNLSGNFKQIEDIATHENVPMKMKSFDDSLMKTCQILKDVTSEYTHCLRALVKSDPLVKWLKESMKKDGLKELKVFVDLALISAGEQPLDIDRVQGLNTAVLGYSPLIFHLNPDADYTELLDKCKLVWKELDTNPKLPEKLLDSNRHLEWLKTIQKAHGSVEVSSLAQAEAINSSGVFSCGFVRKNQDDVVLAPSKVMKLCVRGQDATESRNYTHDQLQDLQSRLMLVAGRAEKEKAQGKDEVEMFTEVFDGVKRLSSVYIKLHDAGCVLFKTWQASFFCDHTKPVCAILEFGQGVGKLKGRRTDEDDTGFIIHRLAKFLESCLEDWLKYINEKRNKYLHLNYFTIDQLVQLQRELVKVGTEVEPSVMVYPLLSAVKKDCTPADLCEAMKHAQQELNMIDVEMADNDSEEEEADDTEDDLRENFIKEMMRAEFDRNLALKALTAVQPDQIDEGIVWCMQHDSDSDNEMDTEDQLERNQPDGSVHAGKVEPAAPWSHSESTVLSEASKYFSQLDQREFGVEPLIRSLEGHWKEFIRSISSNLKDYLSLEHLGLILKNLSRRCTFQVDRPLAGFKSGVPNLVIVPTGDVINTVLSIYMMGEGQPLPQSDEVLVCNTDTTLDEVDIFWRRAIFDGGKKIHCLVSADLLDFDVSDRAEKLLEGYIQDTSHEDRGYRLIVICGSDNEYRSRIVAALDKYRRPALPINVQNISRYLVEKFQVTKTAHGPIPAALVDFQNCSVRVIKSWRAGVGKTLFKQRRERELDRITKGQQHYSVTVPLQEKKINLDAFIKILLKHTKEPGAHVSRIFHLDISHEVQDGVDFLLFNLLVLRCLTDKTGHVWRRSDLDLYLIENMPLMKTATKRGGELNYLHSIFNILPSLTCHSPRESLVVLSGETLPGYQVEDQLFDRDMFQDKVFQRPFQYLLRLDTGRQLQDVNPGNVEGTEQDCLKILLRHCGVQDPSWSELHHFVWFLNTQLRDYEGNNFVSIAAAEDLPGFAKFVLRFLIQMSRDFSTRSLNMSEESPVMVNEMETQDEADGQDDQADLERFQMRRTWESSPHPYLFFNSDRMTFTFLGFYIDRQTGNLIDQQTGRELDQGIMAHNLYDALVRNHVPIQENFDALPRGEKITKLCQVMGMDMPYDPDDTYELTTDNVKKIMAIYMRFRCDIPVIIMGETGCGKTRLVKFMCALQVPPGADVTNMILMKVHGGTTNADIVKKVREAEKLAKENMQKFGHHMYTVLFFDEANTTESIGLIKEIMCDRTMEGQKLELCQNLKIVAACNPYRKHSEELIRKLEQAGLGYHVDADKTTDRLGRVPMRRLVYRVQPLPQSLLPLVWDFGQLNTQVEDLYIRQMVRRYIRERRLPDIPGLVEVVSAVLTASQDYMRLQEDECSFVSLRDVDRVLSVMSWFCSQAEETRTLYKEMDNELYGEDEQIAVDNEEIDEEEEGEDQIPRGNRGLTDITRSLVLALGICYHACLKDREDYRDHVVQRFQHPCELPGGADQMHREIVCCQDVFLSNVRLEKNIARNMALKENVFMMVVCIELRIPLFLVGKPGSSKSLAKTIVSDAMQGNAAHEQLFKELKQAQMVSFQCSPLSTPDGIVGTFRQCAKFQQDKDLNGFVSIVVLDEVGLAEDSPRMPLKLELEDLDLIFRERGLRWFGHLERSSGAVRTACDIQIEGRQGAGRPKLTWKKLTEKDCHVWKLRQLTLKKREHGDQTLHPLLEDGCQGDEIPEEYMKVAFIGISNWALDPAKMNRGILVQREVPDIEELKNSAEGICANEPTVTRLMKPLIEPMAESYLEIFKEASNHREFFGLRDFYSLVKMVFSFAEKSKQPPTWFEMLHAIKRNFGGLEDIDPETRFRGKLTGRISINEQQRPGDPECSPAALIKACLFDTNRTDSESRYLLLLTENYGALSILQQQIIAKQNVIRPVTIFGSSFPSDQEYTQVCRNINKIKVCMETGNTVVLLNLENLYESLYDALNQYYVYFGGERYVDLGLGTHRVKCRVHKQFRLIVVAEKRVVYEKFPIPLINRLEKHFLTINTMLTREQHMVVEELIKWAREFVEQKKNNWEQPRVKTTSSIGDVFMGYHDDTCSAIVLHVWQEAWRNDRDAVMKQVLLEAKKLLLWCATPDSVVKLQKTVLLHEEQTMLQTCYFQEQKHDCLADYLRYKLLEERSEGLFAQVTTHSKLLSSSDRPNISAVTDIQVTNIMLETLQSFDTEQQFSNKIKNHLQKTERETMLMIVQCDSGNINGPLAACARYCVMDELQKIRETMRFPFHVVFIIQLPRIAGGCFTGFQCGIWHSVHIDDLRPSEEGSPTIQQMQKVSPGTLVQHAIEKPVAMETDDAIPNVLYNRTEETDIRNVAEEDMDWDKMERPPTSPLQGMMGQRPETLQLEDVIVDIDSRVGHSDRGPRINISAIILSCVQTALSMVRDGEMDVGRTTKRVALVLELLQRNVIQDGMPSFFDGISRLIAQLLQEKEKSGFRAEDWLLEEAAKPENVQRAGTFRRSCLQVLEAKIAPILAGIIAYLDTNHNLDLVKQTTSPWKPQLWLAVLSSQEALQLTYEYFQSPTRQSNLQEVVVMTTGCEGHLYSAQAPFSWLIYKQIEEILQTPAPDTGDEDAAEIRGNVYVNVLKESILGKLLMQVDEYDTRQDVVTSYMSDYVHMVYHAHSDEEHALVCQSVEYKVIYMTASSEKDSGLLQSLIYIHQAYRSLAPRLKYFRAMNAVWPECSARIMDLKQQEPQNEMFSKEDEFTFSALRLLIHGLTPNKDELNDPKRRSLWLDKVHKYRPVVEKVMSLHREDTQIVGEHSQASVNKAKCLWSRVLAVKLFLEHVCSKAAEEKSDKITIKHCMPLFMMLGEAVDFKELKALTVVEKFLKQCNKTAVSTFIATKEKCCQCEKDMEDPPVILPCKDIICEHCFLDLQEEAKLTCPKCLKRIPKEFDGRMTKGKMSADIAKLKDYQRRCNSFFMDLVSQLCFSDNTPPSDEVIDKLLGYIVCTIQSRKTAAGQKIQLTKELTIFDSGIDPNPVFRSFLLQLIMRTSGETVERNLEKYLRQAEGLLRAGNVDAVEQYIELCLMVIQCLEDIFNQETDRKAEVHTATNRLRHAKTVMGEPELDVQKLYALAYARYGLAVTATNIHKAVTRGVNELKPNERRLIEAAQNLCEDPASKWPKIYLVKYLCRCFGVDTYQGVCRSVAPCLRWLNMEENRTQTECPDRFIICGPTYTDIREALTRVVLGEEIDKLEGKLQELQTARGHTEVMLTLALYREITCANLYPQKKRRVSENVKNHVQEFCEKRTGKQKDLMVAILQNSLGAYCRQLTVHEGEDLRLQGIQNLLIHFLSVMQHLDGANTLTGPLIGLMKQPQQYVRSFIPTMPQDDLEDIREAFLAARRRDTNENAVLYRCPNGHPYVIGNCGNPAYVGTCKCGAVIGGQGYKLQPGNIRDTGEDTTETGHILGRAAARGEGHVQERTLSRVHCSCLRLLTHMSMYLGAANDPQAVAGLIKPMMEAPNVPQFLWDHIDADLNNLQRVFGCSIDDVFILIHSIFNSIMITHNPGQHICEDMSKLTSKKGREKWEEQFSKTHLVPIIQNMEGTLKEGNRLLGQDQRLGADPLLCLLYEIDTPQERIPPDQLQNIPSVWRYRTHITMDHLRREFDSKNSLDKKGKSKYPVLKLFLQEEHFLRALRHIPSILRLHRALFQKYQRKLDKAEASTILVEVIQRDGIAGEETGQMISDFTEAWNLIRNSLEMYVCATNFGGMTVPKELCRRAITDKTPISVLLPTMKEAGLCSFALLDFLLRKQNDFLDRYMKATDRKPDSFSSVSPMDVTAAHLISYDPQQDILPMVLANCQYSFEIGKGTKIEYDFGGLERQLMDRFLFAKSRIDIATVMQLDTMIYRTEFTNAAVFKKLQEKIPQEILTLAVKHQISAEIRSLPDLCQSLDNLDVSISFLKSVGGDPEHNLHGFMSETLKMENPLLSQKASQDCRFKHTQSLWLLLSFLRTKKMAEHRQGRQSMFEGVSEKYHEELPETVRDELDAYFREMSIEKLSVFIEDLHEYITLGMTVTESHDDEEFQNTADKNLKDYWVIGYLETQDVPQIDVRIFNTFPQEILCKHAVSLWVRGYEILCEKKDGHRR